MSQTNPKCWFRSFLVSVVITALLFFPKIALGHPDVVVPVPTPTEPQGQIPEIAVDNIPVESTPIESIVIDESGDSALLPPDDILFVPLIPEEPAPEVPAEPEPTPFVVVEEGSGGDITVVVPLNPPVDLVLPPGTVNTPITNGGGGQGDEGAGGGGGNAPGGGEAGVPPVQGDQPIGQKPLPTPALDIPGGGVAPPAGDPDREKTIVPTIGDGGGIAPPIMDPRPPDDETRVQPPAGGSDEEEYYAEPSPSAPPPSAPRFGSPGVRFVEKTMEMPERSFTMPFRQLDYLPVEDRRKIEAALEYLDQRKRKTTDEVRSGSELRRNLMDVKNAQVLVEYLNPEALAKLLNLPVGAVDTNFSILDSTEIMKALAASYAMAWPDNWSEGAVQPFVQMVVYKSFHDPNYIKAFLILRQKADGVLKMVKTGQNAGNPVALPASQPKTE